jgi:WD40 repeat protein
MNPLTHFEESPQTSQVKRFDRDRSTRWPRVFGYDFFISFKLGTYPDGATSYASDLARRLRERNFLVFFSEEELPLGAGLTPTIVSALSKSRILIVIADEKALGSAWVQREVNIFREKHPDRRVLAIDIDGSMQRADRHLDSGDWLRLTDVKYADEIGSALAEGLASQKVVDDVAVAVNFIKARTKFVVAVWTVVLVICGAACYIAIQTLHVKSAARAALSVGIATQAASLGERDIAQALLLAVAANHVRPTRESERALRDLVGSVESEITHRWHWLSPRNGARSLPPSVAISRNLQLLAYPKPGGEVELVRFNDRKEFAQPPQPVNSIVDEEPGLLRFSGDGRFLIDVRHGSKVRVQDVDSRLYSGDPLDAGFVVSALAVNENGQTILVGGIDGRVRLWDKSISAQPLNLPIPVSGSVLGLAVDRHGAFVAYGGHDGVMRLRRMSDGTQHDLFDEEEKLPPGHKRFAITSIEFNPSRSQIAVGFLGGKIMVWDYSNFNSPKIIARIQVSPASVPYFVDDTNFKPHSQSEGSIRTLSFSPDGGRLAAGTMARGVFVLSSDKLQFMGLLKPRTPNSSVGLIAWDADGTKLVTSNDDGRLVLWQLDSSLNSPIRRRIVLPNQVGGEPVALSSSGRFMAWHGPSAATRVYELSRDSAQLSDVATIRSSNKVIALEISEEASFVAAVFDTGEAAVWSFAKCLQPVSIRDGATCSVDTIITDFNSNVSRMSFLPEGKALVLGKKDGAMELRGIPPNFFSETLPTPHKHAVTDIQIVSNEVMITLDEQGLVAIWDLKRRQKPVLRLFSGTSVSALAFDINASTVVVAQGPKVHIMDAKSLASIGTPIVSSDGVETIAFGPRDQLLLGTSQGNLDFWDLTTRKKLSKSLKANNAVTKVIRVSGNQKHVVAASRADVSLITISVDDLAKEACRIAGRALDRREWDDAVSQSLPYVPLCEQ